MSATFAAPGSQPAFAVPLKLLLGLYAIIPLCLLLQLADQWLWHGRLLALLPTSPNHFVLFQVLFGTPHILASSIILASNRDYLRHYRRRLLAMSAAVIVVFGLGSLVIPYKALYLAVAGWTVYHVLKQQHGIARGVCQLPTAAFQVLLWLSVGAGLFVYTGIFLKNSLTPQQAEAVRLAAAGLCAGLLVATGYWQRLCPGRFGKVFLWANSALVLASFYLYSQQYYFLAILVPRLVHDATAYGVYIVHDYNKHHLRPQNALYRWARHWQLPIFLVLPALSFALAFVLQAHGDALVNLVSTHLFAVQTHKAVTLGLLGYLALMHYYTEAFIWKHGSPCRQFVAFKR